MAILAVDHSYAVSRITEHSSLGNDVGLFTDRRKYSYDLPWF
jgi:hypothetical protein